MPSPFPGMDPYLEGSLWTSVHTQLIAEIARQLTPRLRPRYLAFTSERFVMEMPEDVTTTKANVYPDVGVAESRAQYATGSVAIEPLRFRLVFVEPARVPHYTVEIRDVEGRELVTAVEVLSPTNKRDEGREEYLKKRQRLLSSKAHLLEIDFLRRGHRVPMDRPLPPAPYFVFLSRVETRPVCEVWPIQLNQPLPTVPVPLLAPDPDVPLDLQLAFTTIYDLLNYHRAVDYSRPPRVPLEGEAAAWADSLLQSYRTPA